MSSPQSASPPKSVLTAVPTLGASPEPCRRPSTSTASPRRGSRVRAWSSRTRPRTGCTPRSSAPLSLRTNRIPRANEETEQHDRSEEHTSELQSRGHLVCRLLLEKKKQLENYAVNY